MMNKIGGIIGASLMVGTGLVAANAAAAATTTTYTAPQVTNVRSGQGTNYSIAATVAAGTKITGVLQPSGWVRITSPAADAGKYVYSGVLTAGRSTGSTSPSSGSTITGWVMSSDHQVNVRRAPSLASPIVGPIAREAKVTGQVQGDWVKVSGGYINKGLLETTTANIFNLNGYIPASSMCQVPLAYNTTTPVSPNYTKNTPRYVNCEAVKGLNSLESAYKSQFGHYALIDLAYRSHAEEVYWRNARPNAASPVGTSNHGWGLALDFHEADDAHGNEIHSGEFYWGKSGYNWLAANASKYGFAGDPVPYGTGYESYHWNFAG